MVTPRQRRLRSRRWYVPSLPRHMVAENGRIDEQMVPAQWVGSKLSVALPRMHPQHLHFVEHGHQSIVDTSRPANNVASIAGTRPVAAESVAWGTKSLQVCISRNATYHKRSCRFRSAFTKHCRKVALPVFPGSLSNTRHGTHCLPSLTTDCANDGNPSHANYHTRTVASRYGASSPGGSY